MLKTPLLGLLAGSAIFLTACGQVVTPEPTRTLSPSETPRTTPSAPVTESVRTVRPGSVPDTATPTITPTPVVHVVQRGDTLQAIAFDFGVSVEALQRANGIDNPQFLQVGQHLVIPAKDEPGGTTPGLLLPTPTPHPIQVQGVAFYQTPVDSLVGLGEVANTRAVTLTNVLVEVALLDAAGKPLFTTNTFVSMDIVPPGSRCPFSVLLQTPPPDWASYQVTVLRGQGAGTLADAYVPMSVTEVESDPDGPQFEVTGTITNVSGGDTAQSVDLVVTAYDDEGTVTGFRRSTLPADSLDGGLPPGGEVPFTMELTTYGGVPADFTVIALGRAADQIPSGG